MTTTPGLPDGQGLGDDVVPTEELVRRSGATPFTTLGDLAPGDDPFGSDDEYAEFLADLYASRRTGVA